MPRLVSRFSETHARKAVEPAASQMAQRMAGKRVDREQNNIDQQYQRAHTHSEFPIEIERLKDVFPQENEEQHREIQKVAMDILQDKRKSRLALIVPLPFGH